MTPNTSTLFTLSPESLALLLTQPAGSSLVHRLLDALPAVMALLRVEDGCVVPLVMNRRARRRYVDPPLDELDLNTEAALRLAERLWRDPRLEKAVLGEGDASSFVLVHGVELSCMERLERLAEKAKLSKRQRTILAHVVSGAANKTIASTLGIGESTVEAHMTQLLRRLSVTSRTELIALALKK
ncbi:MAG: helix-turn-helix transcriptional regulator [Myxococcales bacterium]|nr:helix-turn-helix transcriptional regulator [Myxococcales bacterium]